MRRLDLRVSLSGLPVLSLLSLLAVGPSGCAPGSALCSGSTCKGSDDGGGIGDSGPAPTGDSGDSGGEETAPPEETGEPDDTGDEPLPPEPLPLCINELMTDNGGTLPSDEAEPADWIELHNPTDADVSVAGWSFTDDREEADRSVLPEGSVVPALGFALFFADGDPSLGGNHLSFRLDNDGGEVALYADDGRGTIVEYGTIGKDMAAARITDCCQGADCWEVVYAGSPDASNVAPPVIDFDEVTLVPAGSTWSYWDRPDGPASNWILDTYDDSAWPTGAGPLGYGDTHIVTTINSGGSGGDRYYAAYFRMTFTVSDVALFQELSLRLLRDDGAVVYLNGVDVARSNMPSGPTNPDMFATGSVGNETAYANFSVSPTHLKEGENLLTAEIHQATPTSGDLGFDLELVGLRPPAE